MKRQIHIVTAQIPVLLATTAFAQTAPMEGEPGTGAGKMLLAALLLFGIGVAIVAAVSRRPLG